MQRKHKSKRFFFRRSGDRPAPAGMGFPNFNIPNCFTQILARRVFDPPGFQSIRQVQCPKIVHHHLEVGNLQAITEEKVIEVVKGLSLQNVHIRNSVVAIDISLPLEQVDGGMALQISQKILQEIDRQYPTVRDRFVGISDDETHLPLRDLMLTGKLALEEIDNQHLFVFE